MTQGEARLRILLEFRAWVKANGVSKPTGNNGFSFFGDIQKDRPELLDFKASGDKWQVIHGWLLRAGLVSD